MAKLKGIVLIFAFCVLQSVAEAKPRKKPNWLFGGEWSSDVSFGEFRRHPSGRYRYVIEDPVPTLKELLSFIPEKERAENITFVGIYSSLTFGNMDGFLGTLAQAVINAMSHHEFIVLETESGRGISVEKLDDGLVIQNADDPLKLVEWQLSYRRKCVAGMKEGPPGLNMTVDAFLRQLWAKGEPEHVYHVIDENCTDFVARVIDYLGMVKFYPKFEEVVKGYERQSCHIKRSFWG